MKSQAITEGEKTTEEHNALRIIKDRMPSVVTSICNPSTWRAEAGGLSYLLS